MSWWKKATIATDKNKCDNKEQEQKDASIENIAEPQPSPPTIEKVSQSFWNRQELMHSVLFSLIRSAMMSAKPDIKKLRWRQEYSTVPVRNYYGDKISHPQIRTSFNLGKLNFTTGTFEVEYRVKYDSFRETMVYNLECSLVSLSSTSLRIVFESPDICLPDAKFSCWQIPVVLPQLTQPSTVRSTLFADLGTSEPSEYDYPNLKYFESIPASHIDLKNLLDSTKTSAEEFDAIFGTNLVSSLRQICADFHTFTPLPTALGKLTVEYAN